MALEPAADPDSAAAEFESCRPRLFSLAYRMLGSASEAEDAVQDAYLRWHAADRCAVAVPAAWLTKAVANLCLNRLASARARRERYVGPWLPEPVLTSGAVAGLGPLETVEQRESVSLALLTLMERLTPAERAVFVLREAFDHSHREIAAVLDIREANARQLYRRARSRLGAPRRGALPVDDDQRRSLVERFFAATVEGDLAGLEELLADSVTAWADGGGSATAARRPIVGREKVLRYLVGLSRRQEAAGLSAVVAEVNGAPAVLVLAGGALLAVFAPEIAEGRIHAVRTIVSPDKLAFAAAQLAV